MADQSKPPAAVDGGVQQLYPPPPPYFRLAEQGLLSPPPVIEGEYPQFGEIYTTEDGLPALQVRRLYKINDDGSMNIKEQLLALHRELAVSFLELLEVLVDRPSGYARQVENVGLVLRNMIFLANQLRPPQARATVLLSLKQMLESKQTAIKNLQNAKQRADDAAIKAIETLKTLV